MLAYPFNSNFTEDNLIKQERFWQVIENFPLKKINKNAPNKNIAQGRLGAMSVIQVVQYRSFLDDIKWIRWQFNILRHNAGKHFRRLKKI